MTSFIKLFRLTFCSLAHPLIVPTGIDCIFLIKKKNKIQKRNRLFIFDRFLFSVCVRVRVFFSGYGNLAPKTPEGKIVTMVYALFGVPLMLLCISNLGSLLAGTFQFAYSHSCCSSKRKSSKAKNIDKPINKIESKREKKKTVASR